MLIVHATEALGGGVQSAIRRYVTAMPGDRHLILGRPRTSESTGSFSGNATEEHFFGGIWGYLRWLSTVVRRERPDVVHLHSSFAGAARLLLPTSVRIVYSPHCFAFERLDLSPFRIRVLRALEKLLARRRQTIVAVSPHEAELAASLRAGARVFYIPNTTERTESPIVGRVRGRRVIMTGRIGAQKDPQLFADTARLLGSDFEFIWVGDGDEQGKASLELANTQVTGWISKPEIDRVLKGADLYLHTGAWEAAPMSTLEALAAGLPVIARDIRTMASLGYAVAPGSPAELAFAVRQFFENDSYRSRVVSASNDVLGAHSEEEVANLLLIAYSDQNSRHSKRKGHL